jgi:hypothetical protein
MSILENYGQLDMRTLNVTFEDAQKLFNMYSPLQTNSVLIQNLKQVLNFDYHDILSPRAIYNEIILKHYPNETSIKSAFINNILLKSNNHISIFELKVGDSRVDLCKVNGCSTAFEIKTDLDNLQRLNKQLYDYSQIFEKVYVICSSNKTEQINNFIPSEYGIYEYRLLKNGQIKFKHIKESSLSNNINCIKQLEIMTKRELAYNFDVDISNSRDDNIQSIVNKYNSKKINTIFKNCMKMKYQKQWLFLKENHNQIYDIDYQWFFKNTISPSLIYH